MREAKAERSRHTQTDVICLKFFSFGVVSKWRGASVFGFPFVLKIAVFFLLFSHAGSRLYIYGYDVHASTNSLTTVVVARARKRNGTNTSQRSAGGKDRGREGEETLDLAHLL